MGRNKKLKPAELKAGVEAYFDAIRYTEKLFADVPMYQDDGRGNSVPVLDRFGHIQIRREAVIAANGAQAERTVWTQQPKIVDLCRTLGISPTTWESYGRDERYTETVQRAKGLVESYLQDKLLTKDGARGAQFALAHNFGWSDKHEIGLDERTQTSMAELSERMSMREKEDLLRQIGEKFANGGRKDDIE